MVPCSTAPSTILVGISLDVDEAKELLTWAINILSHPHDTIVALHVLVGKEPKKLIPISRDYNRFRRAKTFVLSTMGEFAEDSQCRQVNLEARVRYSASIGSGLIDEAKRTSATFLLLRGSTTKPNEKKGEITKYCMKRAPKGCSIITMGQLTSEQVLDLSSKGTTEKRSPRTVLSGVDRDDDNSSFDNSSSNSESSAPTTTIIKCKEESPLRRVASFFLRNSPRGRRKISESSIRDEGDKLEQPVLKCFSFDEISLATDDFHPDKMIGQGGYSEVYRGVLISDGNSIAVKRLTKDNSNPNKEKEFLMELGIISQVSHPNTATLIGYCIENGLYLIFPLSPNGNLFNALHGNANKPLEWEMRYKIALGVARGLHYLHKSCKHRIIHRDIKASNVLLGPNFEPQITDFGLAKWLPASKNNQHAVLPIEGTFGYLAPEYFMHGIVDEKTDVFAFGILLLEIITGQRPINSSKQSLLLWAMPMMESGKTLELVDPRLEGIYDVEQLQKIVVTASCCVRHSAAWRPTMTEVLELLTDGQDSEHARRWSALKTSSGDEMDDYSMVFGYSLPVDIDLERAVAELEFTLEESSL